MLNLKEVNPNRNYRGIIRQPWLKSALGVILVFAGVALIVFGVPDFSDREAVSYEKIAESNSGEAGFPAIGGRFSPQRIVRYRIGREETGGVELNQAQYQDGQSRRSAIVFPPALGEGGLRHDLWKGAAEAILAHTEENALFVSWWDDAQRIHFLSGRNPWVEAPVAAAYPDRKQRDFWEKTGGGFAPDESKLKQLARWLSMDAQAALREMAQALPKGAPIYFLICLDDLARLGEIEALSGVHLPFDLRNFPQSGNVHSQIAEVKRWAGEKGPGSYLVQQLPQSGVRAWRIGTDEGARTLLARLLPFTSSLEKPLEGQPLVYQSGWGGYLSVYEWRPREGIIEPLR
ncbi:MAG: hydroxylamine oxidation protein HaoB [Methylococcaceae bacterium]|nr:hydroxylamine oxidation protein HaoB [Methylococcaceae bacterium]